MIGRVSQSGRMRLGLPVFVAVCVLSSVLVGSSAAMAGKLPARGLWDFDNSSTNAKVSLTAYVAIVPGSKSYFRVLRGETVNAVCIDPKLHRTVHGGLASFDVNGYSKGVISIKPDGTFSAKLKSNDDVSGGGTFSVKGVVSGIYLSGTITVDNPHTTWGDCKSPPTSFRVRGHQMA